MTRPVTMMATPAPPSQKHDGETLVGKAWDAQEKLEGRFANLGKGKYGRVLRMARKPTPEEYRKAAIVAAAGMALLGAMGFLIYYLMSFIPH